MSDELHEIMRALGRMEELSRTVAANLEEEKARTRDHRQVIYEKIDRLEGSVRIAGQVAAQAREESKGLRKLVDEDVKPATDDFRRMRSFGKWTITAVAFGATALGITVATLGEGVVNWVRSWLRIT